MRAPCMPELPFSQQDRLLVSGVAELIRTRTCPEHAVKVGDLREARVVGVQGNAAGRLGHCHAVVVRVGKGVALQRGPVAQHWQPRFWEALCKIRRMSLVPQRQQSNCRHM